MKRTEIPIAAVGNVKTHPLVDQVLPRVFSSQLPLQWVTGWSEASK
jgi:hypothetical protein